nr:unnamed protein product [Digitaria exilis]
MEVVRRAAYAGKKLGEELDGWLRAARLTKSPDVRAIIAPHAGYMHAGSYAAYAFGNIDPASFSRVFLLSPSHRYYTAKCALTKATVYSTPVGDLRVDQEVLTTMFIFNRTLRCQHIHIMTLFCWFQSLKNSTIQRNLNSWTLVSMKLNMASKMLLPYLSKVFEGHTVKLVPVLIGSLDSESEATYGQLLGKYLDDTKNLFVVSTDFCHWGSKYKYTYYDENHGPIHKSIEALDRIGMEIIEVGNPSAFSQYMQEYKNTICGHHPISVFLHMLKNCLVKVKVKFIRYDQSSQCNAMEDSSVSYACAVGKVDPSGEDEKKE